MKKLIFRKKGLLFWVFFVSAIAHLMAAFFSEGFQAADEYFQILEFAAYKLGLTPAKDLAVEFREQMRPWLLPWIVTWCIRFLRWIGIENPHLWAVFLRLLSGALGWWSSLWIARASIQLFPRGFTRDIAIFSAALLWFVPGLHVRPSSEAWSGAAMAISVSLFILNQGLSGALLSGFFAGVAFETRFQAGVMVAGFILVYLISQIRKNSGGSRSLLIPEVKKLSLYLLGFGVVFIFGRAIDHWGYDSWAFSPWNYLHYNLVRNEVNRFGVSPFWDIFRMSTTEAWPFLGLLLVVLWCVAWVRAPLSIASGATLPFFIVHCVIGHKELRFFFPVAYFSPILLATALKGFSLELFERKFFRVVAFTLVAWNLIGFISAAVSPMSRNVLFFRKLRENGITRVGSVNHDPFEILASQTYFYRPDGWHVTWLRTADDLRHWLDEAPGPHYLFRAESTLPQWVLNLSVQCELQFSALSDFAFRLREKGWLPRANAWTLWKCK